MPTYLQGAGVDLQFFISFMLALTRLRVKTESEPVFRLFPSWRRPVNTGSCLATPTPVLAPPHSIQLRCQAHRPPRRPQLLRAPSPAFLTQWDDQHLGGELALHCHGSGLRGRVKSKADTRDAGAWAPVEPNVCDIAVGDQQTKTM